MDLKIYLGFLAGQVFKPKKLVTLRARSVFDLRYDKYRKGTLFVFDVDDTLTGDHEGIHDDSKKLLIKLKKKFKVAIVTNRRYSSPDIEDFCLKEKILFLGDAGKPGHEKILDLVRQAGSVPEKTVFVGDRATDMWAAYNAGIKERILTEPYSKVFKTRTNRTINFVRAFEKLFLGKT